MPPRPTLNVKRDEVDVRQPKGQQQCLEGQALDLLVRLVAHRPPEVEDRLHQHVVGAITDPRLLFHHLHQRRLLEEEGARVIG